MSEGCPQSGIRKTADFMTVAWSSLLGGFAISADFIAGSPRVADVADLAVAGRDALERKVAAAHLAPSSKPSHAHRPMKPLFAAALTCDPLHQRVHVRMAGCRARAGCPRDDARPAGEVSTRISSAPTSNFRRREATRVRHRKSTSGARARTQNRLQKIPSPAPKPALGPLQIPLTLARSQEP